MASTEHEQRARLPGIDHGGLVCASRVSLVCRSAPGQSLAEFAAALGRTLRPPRGAEFRDFGVWDGERLAAVLRVRAAGPPSVTLWNDGGAS